MPYTTVQEEGTSLTQRSILNFTGDSVTATDNSGSARTDVAVSAVKLQATSPGTAQTGNFNIDGGIGRLAVQDKGGQVFNVKAYGAKADGVTDDTTAISDTITAASAVSPRGVVFFPHGTFKTNGNFDLTGRDGLTIRGSGIGSTTIALAHVSNDLFKYGSGSDPADLTDIDISDFSITTVDGTSRTGGWVIRGLCSDDPTSGKGRLRRSRIERLDVKKQVNGLWINRFEIVWINDVMMSAFVGSGGIGVKAGQTATSKNQGSELRLTNVTIVESDLDGSTAPVLSMGFVIEDCDAVYLVGGGSGAVVENNVKMIAGGHGCYNHFFTGFGSDQTRNSHGVWLTGTGVISAVQFVGCWFASAGQVTTPVTGATNASPIVITTGQPHGFSSGNSVRIAGVTGNTAANGDRTVTVLSSTTFSLNGSAGNGTYTGGGTARLVSSAAANGARLDATTFGYGRIVGCHFANNLGSGLYLANANDVPWLVEANVFGGNGSGATENNNYAVFVDVGRNRFGPNIAGNFCDSSHGADLRTSITSNRLRIVGNDFSSATAPVFGVDPDVAIANSREGGKGRAKVYRTGTQSLSSGVEAAIGFNAESVDMKVGSTDPPIGMHDNSSNNTRLTIPASGSGSAFAGTWIFSTGIEFDTNTFGIRQVKLLKNAATVLAYDNRLPIPGFPTRCALTVQADMVEGDYVEVVAYQNSGAALNTGAGPTTMWFAAVKTP